MLKRILCLILIILSVSATALADKPVTVIVNRTPIISAVPAQLVNSRTMLPMRSIFERLGARVTWMESEQIIFSTKDNLLITMQIGNNVMSVRKTDSDEIVKITLDSPPYIQDGSTMVPVRAVAECMGASVEWDPETYTVSINT